MPPRKTRLASSHPETSNADTRRFCQRSGGPVRQLADLSPADFPIGEDAAPMSGMEGPLVAAVIAQPLGNTG